jgi:hypothetical protein
MDLAIVGAKTLRSAGALAAAPLATVDGAFGGLLGSAVLGTFGRGRRRRGSGAGPQQSHPASDYDGSAESDSDNSENGNVYGFKKGSFARPPSLIETKIIRDTKRVTSECPCRR